MVKGLLILIEKMSFLKNNWSKIEIEVRIGNSNLRKSLIFRPMKVVEKNLEIFFIKNCDN